MEGPGDSRREGKEVVGKKRGGSQCGPSRSQDYKLSVRTVLDGQCSPSWGVKQILWETYINYPLEEVSCWQKVKEHGKRQMQIPLTLKLIIAHTECLLYVRYPAEQPKCIISRDPHKKGDKEMKTSSCCSWKH